MSIEQFLSRRHIARALFTSGIVVGAGLILPVPSAHKTQAAMMRKPHIFKFNLSMGDDNIGAHEIKINQDGSSGIWRHETIIDVRVSLGIFGDITFYHHCIEEWQNGRLHTLMSETDDDGEKYQVNGHTDGTEFVTNGPDGQYRSSGRLMTTNSLWTESFCNQEEVIDAATGGVIGVVIDPINKGHSPSKTNKHQVSSYDVVSAKITGELLYDSAGIWSGGILQKNGQEIKYEQIL